MTAKTTKPLLITALLSIILFCNSCKSPQATTEHYKRQWMLISFKEYTKGALVKNKAALNLTQPPSENTADFYNAFMGCNNIRLKVVLSENNEIAFSDIISTKMFCEDPLESDFLKEITTINQYKIEGHYLSLYRDDQLVMKFIAADWD